MVNSKQKGSNFEREICKVLSLWISKGKREDLFWRSAMSGGRSTVRAKSGKTTAHQAGDICSVHPDGHRLTDLFYIECKAYKDLQAATLLFDQGGKIAQFWVTAKNEAKRYNKEPMLILKQNMYPVMVGVRRKALAGTNPRVVFNTLDLCLYSLESVIKTDYIL